MTGKDCRMIGYRNLGAAAAVAWCLLACACGCTEQASQEKPQKVRTNVEIWKVVPSGMVDAVTLPGVVEPVQAVTVSAEIPGKVKSLPVNEGDEVKKGQVLLVMDKEELELGGQQVLARVTELEAQLKDIKSGARDEEIAQLEAAVESARSARDLAADQAGRRKKLLEDGAVAKELYDSTETALTAAEKRLEQAEEALKLARKGATEETLQASEARLASARAALDLAKKTYEKAEVVSPIDGVIDEKYIEEGELAASGKKLFRIVRADQVKVVVWAPERIAAAVRVGDKVEVSLQAAESSVAVPISRIGFAADSATRTFKLEMILANPRAGGAKSRADRKYRIGYIASVRVAVDTVPDAVRIPVDALVLEGARLLVYTLEKAKQGTGGQSGYRSKANDVQIGLKNSDAIQVTSGVRAGDLLVVRGQRWLKDDEEVNVVRTREGNWPW
jgi:RND family efflux transporter MFP subunit